MPITVRPYRGSDETELLELWNLALPADPIDAPTFRRKVLLDPNFRAAGLIVGELNGQLVAFCLSLLRNTPLEKVGLEHDRGWITALGVHPDYRRQGFGSAVLEHVLGRFAESGRSLAVLAAYVPNYFVPGLDAAAYPAALPFLQRHGFEAATTDLSMDVNLVHFDWAPYREREAKLAEQGVQVRNLRAEDIPAFIEFQTTHMPGDWLRAARELLIDTTRGLATFDQITLALADGEVIGYCQHEAEHFGPFGVRSDRQGQGIGTVLLAHCLESMRRQGLHNAWILWTSERTAEHVYGRFGFTETRRFTILRKTL